MAHEVGAATKETIISPSLIEKFNPSHPIPVGLQIGCEELMGVPINPVYYIRLSTLEMGNVEPTNNDEIDLAISSHKATCASSCAVLAEVFTSEYQYISFLILMYCYSKHPSSLKVLPLKII